MSTDRPCAPPRRRTHPLDRLREIGASALSDTDLLRVLLGREGLQVLQTHGSLHAACAAASASTRLAAILELARRHYAAAMLAGQSLSGPSETRRFLQAQLRDRPYEVFCTVYLDSRHRVIAFEELFRGTLDGAAVHPREVVRQAMAHNAAALILAHNHPSGVAEPSRADELITLRLRDALALLDIRVLDHLIVAGPETLSLAERGLL